mmetsp:Transcript_13110/g.50133  ORF Transcript_13110/g.50133 Transcript_13110/m.50133 type:complete len:304 (+) Transcript_13110:859-1770(+)
MLDVRPVKHRRPASPQRRGHACRHGFFHGLAPHARQRCLVGAGHRAAERACKGGAVLFSIDPHGQRVPRRRLHQHATEEVCRARHCNVLQGADASGAVPPQGDLSGITAEGAHVLVQPLQRSLLVKHAVVARRSVLCSQCRVSQEPERTQAVLHHHDDGVRSPRQQRRVVQALRPGPDHKPAAVEEHHHGAHRDALGAVGHSLGGPMRREHVQYEAVGLGGLLRRQVVPKGLSLRAHRSWARRILHLVPFRLHRSSPPHRSSSIGHAHPRVCHSVVKAIDDASGRSDPKHARHITPHFDKHRR